MTVFTPDMQARLVSLACERAGLLDAIDTMKPTHGLSCFRGDSDDDARDDALIGHEAADIANFAMMLADICGALTAYGGNQ